jgi:hypothetical protein
VYVCGDSIKRTYRYSAAYVSVVWCGVCVCVVHMPVVWCSAWVSEVLLGMGVHFVILRRCVFCSLFDNCHSTSSSIPSNFLLLFCDVLSLLIRSRPFLPIFIYYFLLHAFSFSSLPLTLHLRNTHAHVTPIYTHTHTHSPPSHTLHALTHFAHVTQHTHTHTSHRV